MKTWKEYLCTGCHHMCIREDVFLENVRLHHLFAFIFFIHFSKPTLSRAVVSSFNQFSKSRSPPSRTVGNGHCNNNNNTKSNLNYALKRLGQNNPHNIHKWGGGEAACHQGGARRRSVCVRGWLASWRWGRCEVVFDFGCKNDESVYFGKWVYAGGSESCYY